METSGARKLASAASRRLNECENGLGNRLNDSRMSSVLYQRLNAFRQSHPDHCSNVIKRWTLIQIEEAMICFADGNTNDAQAILRATREMFLRLRKRPDP